MKKKLNNLTASVLFALLCAFIPSGIFSQVNELFSILYTQFSPNNDEDAVAYSVKLDAFGNVYVIGTQSTDSILVIKHNSSGAKLWQKAFKYWGGPITAELDALGNLHVLFNYTQGQIKIVKINPSGSTLWTAYYLGAMVGSVFNSPKQAAFMKIGTEGIYAALYTTNTPDYNYAIVKFSHYGNLNWQKFYNTGGRTELVYDKPSCIAVDENDNVYVTGLSFIDDGPFVSFNTLKYNSGGNLLWSHKYTANPHNVESIAADNAGNVYIGGSTKSPWNNSGLFTLIKYGPSGSLEWTKHHSGNKPDGFNYAEEIKIDPNGYLIAGGMVNDTDYPRTMLVKYSPSGSQIWVNKYTAYLNTFQDFCVTNTGDILVAAILWSYSENYDFITFKYSSSGTLNWSQIYNNSSYVDVKDIDARTDASGNLIFYVTSTKNWWTEDQDILTVKYQESVLPRQPVITTDQTPVKYELKQNYPNPFNPATSINFSIRKTENVRLTIYDALGKEISVLTNGLLEAGTYNVDFDASHLSSGMYFYKLESESFTDIKKMMLVK